MGAWIEIFHQDPILPVLLGSHPTMGAWIEISVVSMHSPLSLESHPTMGAWIEMVKMTPLTPKNSVAPHDGCVD